MCKLCHDFYISLRYAVLHTLDPRYGWGSGALFHEEGMEDMIWAYKGPYHPFGGSGWEAAGNYDASKKWAHAGYNGWGIYGASAVTPPGDRNCSPTCPHAYPALHLLKEGEYAGDPGTKMIWTVTWGDKKI
jgi:hypothetical protein